jgi:ribonuclease BN (tRNA processing enzyme)
VPEGLNGETAERSCVRITVLGKSPSWPDAGGACSGYLIQVEDYRLLLDCGTGVFAALREQLDYFSLDAVLITHMHSDHFFDLVPFSYALTHSPRNGG